MKFLDVFYTLFFVLKLMANPSNNWRKINLCRDLPVFRNKGGMNYPGNSKYAIKVNKLTVRTVYKKNIISLPLY